MARSLMLGSLMVGSLAALSSAAGQCTSTVSLSVNPAAPRPGRPFSVQVVPQNAQWTFEASADGGQSWIEIGQGTSSGMFGYTASLCATTILYRARATSTCPGGGTYTSEPVQVSWPSILEQLAIIVQPDPYAVNILPTIAVPSQGVPGGVIEWSDDAGATWASLEVPEMGRYGLWLELPKPVCGVTRQHRLRSIACGPLGYGPVTEVVIPAQPPAIRVEAPWRVQSQSTYTIEARLWFSTTFPPSISGAIETSDDGVNWQTEVEGVVGASPLRAVLGTSACDGRRFHRFTYTICGETRSTQPEETRWSNMLQPGAIIAPASAQTGAMYVVSAAVPAVSGTIEYFDDAVSDWVAAGTIAGAGNVTLQAPSTPGLRVHRVRSAGPCGETVLSEIASTCIGSPPSPALANQPMSQNVAVGENAFLYTSLQSGSAAQVARYQWFRNGEALNSGFTPWGSIISEATSPYLYIIDAREQDTGLYHVRVTTPCGTVESAPARLGVCYANCDGTTSEPLLSAVDFACFVNRYRDALSLPSFWQLDSYANCDGSTADPVLNTLDFACFLNRYRTGCP